MTNATGTRIRDCRGHRVDPRQQKVVKILPNSPPDKGDIVLVDGVRSRVTYSHIRWDGPRWEIRELRVRPCDD